MKMPNLVVLPVLCLVLGISACSVLGGKDSAKAAAPAGPTPEQLRQASIQADAQQELQRGVARFNEGDYRSTIEALSGAINIWHSDVPTQVSAHKYLAFSYCLTKQKVACKTEFEKAFKIDPNFDLTVAERGHPIWGPVFMRAKQSQSASPAPQALATKAH